MTPLGMVQWMDESKSLNRARALAHGLGWKVAFFIDSICVALGVIALLTFSLAGFDLVKAARLWGGFWTHYADAAPEARFPVLMFMLGAFALTSALVAAFRAPGHYKKRTMDV